MSARRAARGRTEPQTAAGVPADLAAGPSVELWGEPRVMGDALMSARANWRSARDAWLAKNGIPDRELPRELRDRAPFRITKETPDDNN